MNDKDKPRPIEPTLVGAGPESAVVVVGAVGHREVPEAESVETRRMVFEPGSSAGTVPRLKLDSIAQVDDDWPDEPPSASSPALPPPGGDEELRDLVTALERAA